MLDIATYDFKDLVKDINNNDPTSLELLLNKLITLNEHGDLMEEPDYLVARNIIGTVVSLTDKQIEVSFDSRPRIGNPDKLDWTFKVHLSNL